MDVVTVSSKSSRKRVPEQYYSRILRKFIGFDLCDVRINWLRELISSDSGKSFRIQASLARKKLSSKLGSCKISHDSSPSRP